MPTRQDGRPTGIFLSDALPGRCHRCPYGSHERYGAVALLRVALPHRAWGERAAQQLHALADGVAPPAV